MHSHISWVMDQFSFIDKYYISFLENLLLDMSIVPCFVFGILHLLMESYQDLGLPPFLIVDLVFFVLRVILSFV
jgi:hypothetical protein